MGSGRGGVLTRPVRNSYIMTPVAQISTLILIGGAFLDSLNGEEMIKARRMLCEGGVQSILQ